MIVKDPLGRVYPTVSIQEYNKLKLALEQAKAENEVLKTQYRKDVISALHEGCNLKDEDRNRSIESFTKSKMNFEEIKSHLDHLRDSIPKKSHDYIY
jgi:hypothetical protein